MKPVFKNGIEIKEGRYITAGNASQLSDGAAALVLMEAKEATKRGLEPLGAYRGIAVAGCDPDEMGIGPVFAVPKLLKAHGLTIDDIDIWELNEAFAVQVLYCRDRLGIPDEKLNTSGGRHLDRPSLRHDRRALHRSPAIGRQAHQGEIWASSPCALAAAWARRDCSRFFEDGRALDTFPARHARIGRRKPSRVNG